MFSASSIELFYVYFQGIMLFQIVFFGMVYLISGRKDALYYALLNFISAAYFFLNAPNTFFGISEATVFNSSSYLYINFAIFLAMFFMYAVFLKEIFNETLQQYKYVKTTYVITLYAIPLLYGLFVLFVLAGWNSNIIFYTGHMINGPFCTMILILNLKTGGYKKLIIYGMIIIFISVNITIILTVRYNTGAADSILDKYPLAIIKLGMLVDILFFQLALLRKWNDQERQLAEEKLQTQLAVEQWRNKISAELHDDIGSTLSGIAMYSHLTGTLLENRQYQQAIESVDLIKKSANETVDKLGELVWITNPREQSFASMLDKIERYAKQMCQAKNIRFESSFSPASNFASAAVAIQNDLYLLLKESINNAVKYSGASTICFNALVDQQVMKIELIDNGSGFDPAFIVKGNGLHNMEERAKAVGATYDLLSKPGAGTCIRLILKIPH